MARNTTTNKTKNAPPNRRPDHWVPLKPCVMKLAEVKLDPSNARQHNQKNLDAIKGSLKQFGQQKPIVVDANDVCIAGNGTVLAARELGWTEINVVRTTLTGEQARAYAIADNRTGELAGWDFEALAKSLEELKAASMDLGELGWEAHEVDALLSANWTPPDVEAMPALGDDTRHKITFETSEWEAVETAMKCMRAANDGDELTDGKCVAMICKTYRP